MTAQWRAALDLALTTHGSSLDALMSQAQTEGLSDWLAQAIADDTTPPSPAAYLTISDLSGIEVEVLTGEIEPATTLAVAMRSRGQTLPEEVRERPVALHRAVRAVLRLEPYAGLLINLKSFQAGFQEATTSQNAREAGRRAALQLRAKWHLGNEPILDLAQVVENFGVAVEYSPALPSGLHGFTSWTLTTDGWIATITINSNDYWTVQRYSLAHEFCHVLHQDRPDDLTTEITDDQTQIASDPAEARAEAFASNLLAPRAGLAAFWKAERLGDEPATTAAARVMWHWGISRQAACYALQDCQAIRWTAAATDRVAAARVGDMISAVGFAADWAAMTETEGIFSPSVWLTEATAQLFVDHRLPVENYAVATDQDPAEALRQLVDVD